MDNKEFRKCVDKIARKSGFAPAFRGWIKESKECIIVIVLQESNFGNLDYLLIKIFVQGVFGKVYSKNKNLVQKDLAHILGGPPKQYNAVLDLRSLIENNERKQGVELLFHNYLNPFTDKALTRKGIIELSQNEEVFVSPVVKRELGLHATESEGLIQGICITK